MLRSKSSRCGSGLLLPTYPPLLLEQTYPAIVSAFTRRCGQIGHPPPGIGDGDGVGHADGTQQVLPLYGADVGHSPKPAGCVPTSKILFESVYPGAHHVSESWPQQSSSAWNGLCSRHAE